MSGRESEGGHTAIDDADTTAMAKQDALKRKSVATQQGTMKRPTLRRTATLAGEAAGPLEGMPDALVTW